MILKKYIFLFCFISVSVYGQNDFRKKQLTGSVLDVITNKGIQGVQVRLRSTGDIQYTDSEGKFKFTSENGFVVGEPNYSFVLYKEGYVAVEPNTNKVMFGSGDVGSLGMKLDTDQYLRITVIDGVSRDFLSNVEIEIKGEVQETNAQGRVKFNLSNFSAEKVTAVFSLDCYKDEILEVPTKGEKTIRLISVCNKEKNVVGMDALKASQILDRVLISKNGSRQGQIEAIHFLRDTGYDFNSVNFEGVYLDRVQLPKTNLKSTKYDYCRLNYANFKQSKMSSGSYHFAVANNANFDATDFSNNRAVFFKATNSSFKGADLSYSYFLGCDFSNTDFTGANLTGAIFALCNLAGAKFNNADLTNAGLSGSVLNSTLFTDATIDNTEITGAVSLEKKFDFSAKQEKGLCTYVYGSKLYIRNSNNYLTPNFNFKFELTEVVPKGGGGDYYFNLVRESAHFESFGGGNCEICDSEKWNEGKAKTYYTSYHIYKDRSFLKKDERIGHTKKTVKQHLNFLREQLQIKNTYRNESDYNKWKSRIESYFRLNTIDDNPNLDIDVLTMKLVQDRMLSFDKIPWKLLTLNRIRKKTREYLLSSSTVNEGGVAAADNKLMVPPMISVTSLPSNWIKGYKDWVFKNSKSNVKPAIIDIYTTKNSVSGNVLNFSIPKGRGLNNDGEFSFGKIMNKHGVDPDYTTIARVDKFHYYTMFKEIRYVFPDYKRNYSINVAEGTKKEDVEIRLKSKIKKLQILKAEKDYLLIFLDPIAFEHRTKGSEKWNKTFFDKEKTPFDLDIEKSIKNKALLSRDVLLAAMLNKKLISINDFRISNVAYKHFEKSRSFLYAGKPFPYQYIFPKDIPKRTLPYNYVEKYQNWLNKNTKIGVESFCIPIKLNKENSKDGKQFIEFWNDGPSYTYSTIKNYLEENNIEKQRVKNYSKLGTTITKLIDEVILVYPKERRMAFFKANFNFKETDTVECRVELKLDKIDYLTKAYNKKVILHVKPIKVYYRINNSAWKVSTEFMP